MRDTRAALVAAAIATLRDSGFAAASARRIAAEAGCNQALIFYHFGSVTELLLAALDAVSERRMAAYRGVLDHADSLKITWPSGKVSTFEELKADRLYRIDEVAGLRD